MSAIELADSFEGIRTHWSFWGQQQEIVATLRSQHERIKELESENSQLRQEYAEHPDESIEKCLEFIECVPIELSRNPATVAEWWGRYRSLAKYVRAELAQREREAAERALPVTEEWLLANGWTKDDHGILRTVYRVRIFFNGDRWYIAGNMQEWTPTRGHILDLLSALGAGKGIA